MATTFVEEMDTLGTFVVNRARTTEIVPMLVLVRPKGDTDFPTTVRKWSGDSLIVGLDVGNGREQARAARMMVLMAEPEMAMIANEGWTTRQGVPITDPDVERVLRGEIGASQLPPHKQAEMLTVYGETPEGESETRLWYVERTPDGGFPRRIEAIRMEQGDATTRFRPLFLVDEALRKVPMDGALSPEQARAMATVTYGAILLADPEAGTTSYAHQGAMDRLRAKALMAIKRQREEGR